MANINGVGYATMVLDAKGMTKNTIQVAVWRRFASQYFKVKNRSEESPKLADVRFVWMSLEDLMSRGVGENLFVKPVGENAKPKIYSVSVDENGKPHLHKHDNDLMDEDEVKMKLMELALNG